MAGNKLTGYELHLDRYLRHRGGMTPEAIAEMDGCKVQTVDKSIALIQAQRNSYTAAEVDTTQHETLIRLHQVEMKMLMEAMQAMKCVEDDGKLVRVPDWETRMQAEKAYNEKYGITRHKGGGGVSVQVGMVNQQRQEPAVVNAATSFEEILRKVNTRREQDALQARNTQDQKLLEGPMLVEGG